MAWFSRARKSYRPHRNEDGYVMLTMLLVISLMAIAAAAVIPAISYQIRRDQETEMIHRGVQYSRAIRAYFKKFGRYPARLEDLDHTNNLRYLRKHYKDPVTGKDFRLLHYGEQGVTLAGGLAGGNIPGANPIGGPGGNNSSGGNSLFGGSSFSNSGFGNSSVNTSGVFAQTSGTGASTNSTPGQPVTSATAGSDSSPASAQVKAAGQEDDSSNSQQPVTNGAIVGVASLSKKTGIREFNHKKKYNEWQFVYDPTTDRGSLITTPNQPTLQGFGGSPGLNNGQQPGAQGSSPFGQSPFGQSSFGQSGGFNNNNPNPTSPPAQPPSTTPQQQ